MSIKIGFDSCLFSRLHFPRATILDFMTSYGCCYCREAEDFLCRIIGHRITS